MGLFSAMSSIVRGAGGLVASAARSPIGKAIPGVAGAVSVYSAVSGLGGGGGSSLPPSPFGGSMPKGGFGVAPMAGNRGIFRNDANVPDNIKPYVISKGDLRQYYRAPKGYVIMKDAKGDPMGVPKYIAKMYGWKPAKKPLLSIRDTNAIRHSGAVINKLKKFNKTVEKIANFHSSPRRGAPRNIIIEKAGQRVIGRKVA